MKLVIATRNTGKFKEIKEILDSLSVNLLSLNGFSNLPEVVEDGLTFRDNALKKAKVIAEATKFPVLAEDSGLEIKSLDEKPGIYSARFAGEDATDAKNIEKVLGLMKDVPKEKRQARFITVACLFIPASFPRKWESRPCSTDTVTMKIGSGELDSRFHGNDMNCKFFTEGICKGSIAFESSGTSGFGYDPIFVPKGYKKTFAELGETVKNRISHRAKAIRVMRRILRYRSQKILFCHTPYFLSS